MNQRAQNSVVANLAIRSRAVGSLQSANPAVARAVVARAVVAGAVVAGAVARAADAAPTAESAALAKVEEALRQLLVLMENPPRDAMEQCIQFLEPCVESLAAIREAGGSAEPAGKAVLRDRLRQMRGQLQRLAQLMHHAAEFRIGCAVASVAAAAGYSRQGTSVPELPVRRLRMEC